jgi:hypothetical protein
MNLFKVAGGLKQASMREKDNSISFFEGFKLKPAGRQLDSSRSLQGSSLLKARSLEQVVLDGTP